MHFSALTWTAAVTASCLLSSGWGLPQRDNVRDSHQQGLMAGRAEVPSQTVLLRTATFHDDRQPRAVNHPNRFRVQKRENPGESESGYNHFEDEEFHNRLAEYLMQQMASTQHPIGDIAVAKCMAGYIIRLIGRGTLLNPALMLEYKAVCEAKGGIHGGAATRIPPPRKRDRAPESGPLMFARHQLGKSAPFLQRLNPARIFRGLWSKGQRETEARAAAMRPVTQGMMNTLKKDMILEEKGL
ncbi:MAG: hypothetical protein M1826_006644 [Phylliscum demangeonii]|nr:MAG: hypothetical protein M1826_006644 [Phylliscum demangeonii]